MPKLYDKPIFLCYKIWCAIIIGESAMYIIKIWYNTYRILYSAHIYRNQRYNEMFGSK